MKNRSLKFKLSILSIFLLLALTICGANGLITTQAIGNDLKKTVTYSLPNIRNLTLIDMAHDGIRGCALEAILGAYTKDQAKILSAENDLSEHNKNVIENFKNILASQLSPQMRELTLKNESKMKEYVLSAQKLIDSSKKMEQENASKEFLSFQEKFKELEESLEAFGDFSQNENHLAAQKSLSMIKNSTRTTTLLFLFSLIFAISLATYITMNLTKSINDITKRIMSGANEVGVFAKDLADASSNLSDTTSEQASAIQETSASVTEISAMVKHSSESANDSTKTSHDSRSKAERGQTVVRMVVDSMDNIKEKTLEIENEINLSNQQISEIAKMIQDIGTKTKVIDDIVFQTKLLSFNASVEAARAGENGKGFAVVAEEVGNLAQMSGNAAKEISTLLDESVSRVEKIIAESTRKINSLMSAAKLTAEKGSVIVVECGDVLNEIVESSSQVSSMVVSIAHATTEQAVGVNEIAKAVQQLDIATNANAASANQVSQAASSLLSEADQLKKVSDVLNSIVYGA
ncbi:MAG: MCP four helix bundle domain-containing protein [Bacteriovorax sp.]|nr:MCP four helix bundle domain-containing protein [Bacteriovorax sp.]